MGIDLQRTARCKIELEAISLNHSHSISTKSGKVVRFKNAKTKSYEDDFRDQFLSYKEDFLTLASLQKYLLCPIHVTATFHIAVEKFYKKGTEVISQRCPDLDNILKLNIDLICREIDVNDVFITKIVAIKKPSLIPQMEFHFELIGS